MLVLFFELIVIGLRKPAAAIHSNNCVLGCNDCAVNAEATAKLGLLEASVGTNNICD